MINNCGQILNDSKIIIMADVPNKSFQGFIVTNLRLC